jgi:hypothetical protein
MDVHRYHTGLPIPAHLHPQLKGGHQHQQLP